MIVLAWLTGNLKWDAKQIKGLQKPAWSLRFFNSNNHHHSLMIGLFLALASCSTNTSDVLVSAFGVSL